MTTFTNVSKSTEYDSLLLESGDYLLQENGDKILLESHIGNWANVSRNSVSFSNISRNTEIYTNITRN